MSAARSQAELLDPVRRALRCAADAGADAADAVLVGGESIEARVRGEEIDFVSEAREHVLGIRALLAGDAGFRSAITCTSDLSDDAVERMARDAVALARATAADPAAGLPDAGFADDDPELSLLAESDRGASVDERLADAFAAERSARESDPRIANSEGSSSRGGKKSGSGGSSKSSSSQGGTSQQKKAAGRKGGKAAANKS